MEAMFDDDGRDFLAQDVSDLEDFFNHDGRQGFEGRVQHQFYVAGKYAQLPQLAARY